jgi:hypothetical protein
VETGTKIIEKAGALWAFEKVAAFVFKTKNFRFLPMKLRH